MPGQGPWTFFWMHQGGFGAVPSDRGSKSFLLRCASWASGLMTQPGHRRPRRDLTGNTWYQMAIRQQPSARAEENRTLWEEQCGG